MGYEEEKKDIEKIYQKFKSFMDINQDDDKFYKYIYNLLETGNNFCTFTSESLIKTIDEEWIENIENAINALHHVVQNPTKFIEEDRQIVNIALARNILSESVQHLLQHSNMIDKVNKDGTVIPNRILNVYKEESYNTYENRFIYTLVLELQRFVNKRFDVIFSYSEDEIGTNFEVESTIENYTEIIDYKLNIHIKERQSAIMNDDENADVFARIAKIHKQVNDLSKLEFMKTMREFPLVRHPIVKTNVIKKNVYYKECHKLWNFIHGYERVGYCVDAIKQEPIISREFEKDIYNTIIMNYVLIQNYLEATHEFIHKTEPIKKEISVKEVRQSLSELVNNSDMPDSQLRKIVLSELNDLQIRKRSDLVKRERVFHKKKGKKKG